MFKLAEVLGCGWGIGNLVVDYLMGGVWWAWAIDAGFTIAGIVSGGLIAAVKMVIKKGLKTVVKKIVIQQGKKAAVKL